MDINNFANNPIGEMFSIFTDSMGVYFYAGIMLVLAGYATMKGESWYEGAAVCIIISIFFGALLPMYIVFIFAIAAAFSFAAVITQVFILR